MGGDPTCDARRSGALAARAVLARAAVILVALAAGTLPALPGRADHTRTFDIAIKDGQVVGRRSARVSKGDAVVLRWTSDRRLELHLHGYDVKATVSPGAPAEMRVQARATGRFPVEVHGPGGSGRGHQTIFHLEVYPD